jgi:hypothetical protein
MSASAQVPGDIDAGLGPVSPRRNMVHELDRKAVLASGVT